MKDTFDFEPPDKCELCPYFSGVSCHGHGEYYGFCSILKALYGSYSYSSIVYDDTKCLLKKHFVDDLLKKEKTNL